MRHIIGQIPVYIVMGFLSTGKTTLTNYLLRERRGAIGRVVMEEGRTAPDSDALVLPILTEANVGATAYRLREMATTQAPSELWLEWNGMVPFSLLERLFLSTRVRDYYKLQHIYFVATPAYCTQLLGRTGTASLSQLREADTVLLFDHLPEEKGMSAAADIAAAKQALRGQYPGSSIRLVSSLAKQRTRRHVVAAPSHRGRVFLPLVLVSLTLFYTWALRTTGPLPELVRTTATLTMATLLQALSFLLLGLAVSSALQLFVPPSFLARRFRGSTAKGLCQSLVAAFCFPVCDCAAVPLFQTFLRQGVPVPAALFFLLAGPIVNPIVIASTYYAFQGQSSIVVARISLGLLIALVVSLSFYGSRLPAAGVAADSTCTCLRYVSKPAVTKSEKWFLYVIHMREEFFRMAPYVVLAAFLTALFQVCGKDWLPAQTAALPAWLTILVMEGAAFFLSLCSTADAAVARSFSSYVSVPGVLAFLLLGPMLDVKNALLLSRLVSWRFTLRLALTLILCVSLAAAAFSLYQTGGVPFP